MYSRIAGTGLSSASSGSQIKAERIVPSLSVICSFSRIWRGKGAGDIVTLEEVGANDLCIEGFADKGQYEKEM
jgi:hypothetical protein